LLSNIDEYGLRKEFQAVGNRIYCMHVWQHDLKVDMINVNK